MLDWLLVPDCDFDTTFVANVCDGEDFIFQGVAYAIGTTNTVQGNSAQGCDSIFNFTVNALMSTDEVLEVMVCPGETYSYQGGNYGIGTNESFTFMNSVGCDSIVQLQVVASPTSNELLEVMVCPGETYNYLGTEYAAGSSSAITLTNSAGCDSTIRR